MSQSDDDFVAGWLTGLVMTLVIVFVVVALNGCDTRASFESEAVRNKAGRYVPNASGAPVFLWNGSEKVEDNGK